MNYDVYAAPPDTVFDDIKKCATAIWKTYDNAYGYVDEKLMRILPLQNEKDNWLYIVNMFDKDNKNVLLANVQPETRTRILAALL